jgi:hypothetical protein
MKRLFYLLPILTVFYFISCSNSPDEKAQVAVKEYLKLKLKNPDSYEPLSFSKIDTFKLDLNYYDIEINKIQSSNDSNKGFSNQGNNELLAELQAMKEAAIKKSKETPYSITHYYTVINSNNERVKMSVKFRFDEDFNVVDESVSKSINGEYGSLAGIVYWKYNNYVGNKPDIGADVRLFSLDSIRGRVKYETSVDAEGKYKLEKILPGRYLQIVRSKNATNCPEEHLSSLTRYSDEIKELFDFDINKYKSQLNDIKNLDSLYSAIVLDDEISKYGGLSQKMEKYSIIEREIRDKAEILINSFPLSFTSNFGIYSAYSYALDIRLVWIEEDKIETKDTDFGITCI